MELLRYINSPVTQDPRVSSPTKPQPASSTKDTPNSNQVTSPVSKRHPQGEDNPLQPRITGLEEEIARLKRGANEFTALLNSIRAGKEQLQNKIRQLEEQVQSLEREREELQKTVSTLTEQKEEMLRETTLKIQQKDAECEALRAEISSLQLALRQRDLQIEDLFFEKDTLLQNHERLRKDFASYVQKTRWSALVIGLATLVIVFAVAIRFIDNTQQRNVQQSTQTPLIVATDESKHTVQAIPEPNPTILQPQMSKDDEPGSKTNKPTTSQAKKKDLVASPQLRPISMSLPDLSIDITPINSDSMGRLPSAMKGKLDTTRHYYIVTLRAKAGLLSERFIQRPKIDFINQKKQRAGRIVTVKRLNTKTPKVSDGQMQSYEYLVSYRKDFHATAVVVEDLNESMKKLTLL